MNKYSLPKLQLDHPSKVLTKLEEVSANCGNVIDNYQEFSIGNSTARTRRMSMSKLYDSNIINYIIEYTHQ